MVSTVTEGLPCFGGDEDLSMQSRKRRAPKAGPTDVIGGSITVRGGLRPRSRVDDYSARAMASSGRLAGTSRTSGNIVAATNAAGRIRASGQRVEETETLLARSQILVVSATGLQLRAPNVP